MKPLACLWKNNPKPANNVVRSIRPAPSPAQSNCAQDSLPIRLEIPLNTINLPEGIYEVNVNGAVGTFTMPVH
jgi:hypothetical protein